MARLFIIGNGFDLAHGYKSKYSDFRDWMLLQLSDMGISGDKLEEVPEIPFSYMGNHGEEYDQKELMKLLMWLLQYGSHIDSDWNEFENSLYWLDLQAVMDDATMFIDDGLENEDDLSGRRSDNQMLYAEQDYIMYAEALRDALAMIKELFARWIKSIEVGGNKIAFGWEIICDKGQGIRPDDIFISVNYTETLEVVYGVPESQVFHLHGYRKGNGDCIVGHGDDLQREFNMNHIMAADLLEEAIRNLRKDTDLVIRENAVLWERIKEANISDVYSFGFSFNTIDFPYIREIVCLLESSSGTVWHLSSRDEGEKNAEYTEKIKECGFQGRFDIYDSDRILLRIDDVASVILDSFDRLEKFSFYYDESNFFGKLYIQEKDGGHFDYNFDIDRDLVLAGIVTEDQNIDIDEDGLRHILELQNSAREIKFRSQFNKGDFLKTIDSERMDMLLGFFESKDVFIHVAQINLFYFAVVDIIDSVIDIAELEEYAADPFGGDLIAANHHLKEVIYKVLKEKKDGVLDLFNAYGYPDIDEEDIEDFCDDLICLIGPRRELSTDLKYITGMIKKAGEEGEIIFLQGNKKRILVDDLAQFYLHFIGLFPDSEHFFDEQKEIKKWLNRFVLVNDKEEQVDNYSFVDSKDEVLIQLSDIVSGVLGQMYMYLNKSNIHTISRDVKGMSNRQLECAGKLFRLLYRSSERNRGFFFSITAGAVRKRFELFAEQINIECRRRIL